MKKMICLAAMVFFVMGCASTGQPYKLFTGEAHDTATLTSAFDSNVKKLVEEKLKVKTSFGGPKLSAALLRAVDDAQGNSIMPYIGRTFNSSWNGQFDVEVLPGQHQLVVMPDYHLANQNDLVSININTISGHRYFVGHVLDITSAPVGVSGFYISRGKYRWFPVVVDITEMSIIYPEIK